MSLADGIDLRVTDVPSAEELTTMQSIVAEANSTMDRILAAAPPVDFAPIFADGWSFKRQAE